MTTNEILKRWLTYSGYDPEQSSFNLLSSSYLYHKAGKVMTKVMEYDPSGVVALIYAKDVFLQVLKDSKVGLYDLFSEPGGLDEHKAMWDIFMSDDVVSIEQHFMDKINAVVERVVMVKQIGERDLDLERKALFESVSSVAEQLTVCKTELFMRGGPILPITNFSTKIHVFERVADCLLAIEAAPDGMYLCYINCYGTSDGYFGFFVKSNGSVLSVSERVDEAYPGQHKYSRNGRWTEAKKYSLFPYAFIFSFSEHDYLGYASKHTIDDSKLEFRQLEPSAYMPLILAMVMLSHKLSQTDITSMKLSLVDSMFQRNLDTPLPGTTDLVIPSNSALAIQSRTYEPSITTADVLGRDLPQKLSDNSRPWGEQGSFPDKENFFVEMYGDGFELDASKLLVSNPELKALPADKLSEISETPDVEFVGTADRMELIAYMQARRQLAEYVRKRMFEDYKAFGGAAKVDEWFIFAILARKEFLFQLCVRKYLSEQETTDPAMNTTGLALVNYYPDAKNGYVSGTWGDPFPFNEHPRDDRGREIEERKLCAITGANASVAFCFNPETWEDIESLLGPVPRVLKGWLKRGHDDYGNCLLNATDACAGIGNLFEEEEHRTNRRFRRRGWFTDEDGALDESELIRDHPRTDFSFGIAFSKRGLSKLLKMNWKTDTPHG